MEPPHPAKSVRRFRRTEPALTSSRRTASARAHGEADGRLATPRSRRRQLVNAPVEPAPKARSNVILVRDRDRVHVRVRPPPPIAHYF